ncbi:lipoprotein [Dorcoceras hygrometricum]|uniref:Lipoprotein n=1 Tax=Dorcoceras hygrometricum TaxID=472368 RepID=A0A2Z7B366_9LAMI|nr:lipoprotein [Dorcoceras hygrometricum]
MAYSPFVNTLQVDFASVLAMEHTGMVRMFKSLEDTGLRGFLEGTTYVFENAVTEFFANAKIIARTIISTGIYKLHSKKVLTSRSVQAYIKQNQDIIPEGEPSTREDTASNPETSLPHQEKPAETESLAVERRPVAPTNFDSEEVSEPDSCPLVTHRRRREQISESSDTESTISMPLKDFVKKRRTQRQRMQMGWTAAPFGSQPNPTPVSLSGHVRRLSRPSQGIVVFGRNDSAGHHIKSNVGPFRHDDSAGRSQRAMGIQLSKEIKLNIALLSSHTKLKSVKNHLPKAVKEQKNYWSTIAKTLEHSYNFSSNPATPVSKLEGTTDDQMEQGGGGNYFEKDLEFDARKEHEGQKDPKLTADKIKDTEHNSHMGDDDQIANQGCETQLDSVNPTAKESGAIQNEPVPVEEYFQMLFASAWDNVSERMTMFEEWLHFRQELRLRDISSVESLVKIEEQLLEWGETKDISDLYERHSLIMYKLFEQELEKLYHEHLANFKLDVPSVNHDLNAFDDCTRS